MRTSVEGDGGVVAGGGTEQLEWRSGDALCRGTWFAPVVGGDPAPAIVLAHGLGGTADSGLEPFARAFAAAGIGALTFDYRGFGRSEGGPRQTVSVARQQQDYRSALDLLALRADVDPERLALWGCSLSGGHVLEIAAERPGLAAVVAMVPMFDGRAAAVQAVREHPPLALARSAAATAVAAVRARTPLGPAMIPVVGPPGSDAALSLEGYEEAYRAIAGPSWTNRIDAGIGAVLGGFRPSRRAAEVRVPLLVQIADLDRSAPPHAAAKTAFAARAEVRHHPGDHLDLFPGRPCHERAVEQQVLFLCRHLGVWTA